MSHGQIDYRKILAAYMEHVGETEGTDFVGCYFDDGYSGELSHAERIALLEVCSERRGPGSYGDDIRRELEALKSKTPAQR